MKSYEYRDCICGGCIHCDKELDDCKIGRWRYPTDGCFDYQETEDGENALTMVLKAIKKKEVIE